MEVTYQVRASDGNEYGPVALEQLAGWLQENRISGENEIRRSDMAHWARARDFTELQSAMPAPPPARSVIPPITPRVSAADPALALRLKSGASWFYWIAGLSLINSIVALTGSNWRFIVGLGVTQVFDAFSQSMSGGGKVVALILSLLVAGIFVVFGIFANKRQHWAFIAGMILFGLDGMISLLIQDWLGLGFHAFALYCIFRGFAASREINKA